MIVSHTRYKLFNTYWLPSWLKKFRCEVCINHWWDEGLPLTYLHNHPWWCFSVILIGGYWEIQQDRRWWMGPFSWYYRPKDLLHTLDLKKMPDSAHPSVWTLFVYGPSEQQWQYQTENGLEVYTDTYRRLGIKRVVFARHYGLFTRIRYDLFVP